MRVALCHAHGIDFAEQPTPTPNPEQLLVRVYAAGINRADLLQRQGKYPPPAGESAILGLEIAGEVVACGAAVTPFSKGQRVFGLVAGGGYAEYCLLDQGLALPIPERWEYTTAAAIPETFITAHQCLFEVGEALPHEICLIHAGGSGVGTAAIQMARANGMTVYFTAGSDAKIQKGLALGATAGINYQCQTFATEIARLTADQGVDVILDCIGGESLSQNLLALAPGGRLVQIAFMGGRFSHLDLAILLRNYLQIKASVLRTRPLTYKRGLVARFKSRWLACLERGEITPVIDTIYPFTAIDQAHAKLQANQNFGKLVLDLESL